MESTMRSTWSHTSTSRHAVEGFTGFAGVASYLNTTFGTAVSRQLVCNWYRRRPSTKFPEKKTVESQGRTLELFNLEEVNQWYTAHRLA